MVWKASKSERASHGGSMAGLKAWMNGCMSVDDRSDFSYQVAAGSTRSDSSVVDVIRKSIDIIRSSLPSGMSRSQTMSRGRSSGAVGSARTLPVVPSRCLRKYSLPLLDEPSRFARQAVSTRGQFRSASGSVTASCQLARGQLSGNVRRRVDAGRGGVVGEIQAAAVELREERHPAHRHRRGQHVHGVQTVEPAAAQRRGQRVGAVAVIAPLIGMRVPVAGADHLPRRAAASRCPTPWWPNR